MIFSRRYYKPSLIPLNRPWLNQTKIKVMIFSFSTFKIYNKKVKKFYQIWKNSNGGHTCLKDPFHPIGNGFKENPIIDAQLRTSVPIQRINTLIEIAAVHISLVSQIRIIKHCEICFSITHQFDLIIDRKTLVKTKLVIIILKFYNHCLFF